MKRFLVSLILSIILVCYPICPLAFDKEQGKLPWTDQYWDLSTTVVIVQTIGSGYGSHPVVENGKEVSRKALGTFQITGMGTIVKHKSGELYVITASHVVEPEVVCIQETTNTYYNTSLLELIDCKVMITDCYGNYGVCPVKVTYKNHQLDLAVLKVPKEWAAGRPIGIELQHTIGVYYSEGSIKVKDWLEVGDAVVIVSKDKESWWYVAKKGIVRTVEGPWFTSTASVEYGDSGSPVFVFVQAKPIFIGVLRARGETSNGKFFSQIVRLDPIVTRVFGTEGF